MSNTTFGEVSWNDSSSSFDKKANNNKDVWLRLESGDNEVRLITAPFQYLSHQYKKEKNDRVGQKVYCSEPHGKGTCPVCAMVNEKMASTDEAVLKEGKALKAKTRWLVGVIDRRTKSYKILDISWAVFSQIKKLAQNTQRWGSPTDYDINIFVDKNGGATGYYSVQPLPKEILSAEDQKIRDNVDLDDLKRRVTPPTAEQVQKRLDKIHGIETKAGSKPNNQAPATTPVSLDDDDMNDDFPAFQG